MGNSRVSNTIVIGNSITCGCDGIICSFFKIPACISVTAATPFPKINSCVYKIDLVLSVRSFPVSNNINDLH